MGLKMIANDSLPMSKLWISGYARPKIIPQEIAVSHAFFRESQ